MRLPLYPLLLITLSFDAATANVELANFPTYLCPSTSGGQGRRASEVERAAAQLSSSWPRLRLSSASPSLFSLSAPAEQADNERNKSSGDGTRQDEPEDLDPFSSNQGAWVTLELDELDRVGQGNDLISNLKQRIFEVYQLRASWPANFPVDLTISVHTPSSMLSLGSVVWQTEEELRSAVMTPAPTHMAQPTSTSKHQTDKDGSAPDRAVSEEVDLIPCSTLYAHIGARSHSVRIPSKSKRQTIPKLGRSAFSQIFKYLDFISTYLYDPLVPEYHQSCSSSEMQKKLTKEGVVRNQAVTSSASNPRPTSAPKAKSDPKHSQESFKAEDDEDFRCTAPLLVPIHLTLERFYFGAIPQTSLDLLILLLPILSFTLIFILPKVRRGIRDVLGDQSGEVKWQ